MPPPPARMLRWRLAVPRPGSRPDGRRGAQEARLDQRVEHGLPGGGRAHRQGDLLAPRILGEEAERPCFERAHDAGVIGEGREDHDLHGGKFGRQAAGRRHPVDVGHAQVHQHHLGREAAGQFDGLVAVGGQADHLEARLGVEHGGQRLAHGPLVVRHHDAQGRDVVAHRPTIASPGFLRRAFAPRAR